MRRAAARGKADSCQPECIRAIQLLGLPFRVLSANGGGVGDVLVLMPAREKPGTLPYEQREIFARAGIRRMIVTMPAYLLEVECKVPVNKKRTVQPSQYTEAQKKWRDQTPNAPRITVTGFEDTLRQLRDLMGSTPTTPASASEP